MSAPILEHTLWPEIARYLQVSVYGRDGGPDRPRWRFDIRTPDDGITERKLLAIAVPCVTCGRMMHPIRSRQGRNHLYLAVTCSLDVNFGCARSSAARKGYEAIRQVVKAAEQRRQPRLAFDLGPINGRR